MKQDIFEQIDLFPNAYANIDLAEYSAMVFLINKTGNTTFKLVESDDGTTFTDVDAKHVRGTLGTANGVYKVEYIGYKRFVKADAGTPASVTIIPMAFNPIHQKMA